MYRSVSIDRISDFPDPILGKILSYLPTKNAVGSSILSKRWTNLFPSDVPLTQLYLDDTELVTSERCHGPSRGFDEFVDKLFDETLLGVHSMEKIVLNCANVHGQDKVLGWVRAAVRLSVRNLKLNLKFNLKDLRGLLSIIDGCGTLVELEIGCRRDLDFVPDDFILPSLRRLTLRGLCTPEDGSGKFFCSIHELLNGCPVLEELSIVGCEFPGVSMLFTMIQSGSIKKLVIKDCCPLDGFTILPDLPNLECFVFEGDCVPDFSVHMPLMTLNSVSIDLNPDEEVPCNAYCRVAKLVKAFSRANRMCLYGRTLTELYRSLKSVPLPRFRNLTCLALGTMGRHGWEMLALLLQKAPKLELLKLEQGFGKYTRNYAAFESFLSNVPDCLKYCFKKIQFWEFQGQENEIEFIEYILKNGRMLQELVVYCHPRQSIDIFPRLSSIKKCSMSSQILVLDQDDRIISSCNSI